METDCKFMEFFETTWATLSENNCWCWALIGFAAGIVLSALCLCIFKNRKSSSALTLADTEKGKFSIKAGAFAAFVKSIAARYTNLTMTSVKLAETRNGVVMNISLKAVLGTELVQVRKDLRNEIFSKMNSQLGITSEYVTEINFDVVDFIEPEEPEQPDAE